MRKKVIIVFSAISFVCIFLFVIFNFVIYKKPYSNIVSKYANQFDLEPALVFAVIKAESDFDKTAVSSSGAMGLMQIMPNTAKWIASELEEEYFNEKMFNPETNIKYGCFYLNYLFKKFSDTKSVICAYNAGETIVAGWLDEGGRIDENKIAYKETKTYLKRVEGFFNIYKS